MDIARQRLHNEHLTGPPLATPADVVAWLGAVQAQDYAGAKWALGQRTRKTCRDADVEAAFQRGDFLRTHVMRPTWHFVAPADLRWLLKLTAPRVHAISAYYRRKNNLTQATFRRSNRALEKALRDGKHLTRDELGAALATAGIPVKGEPLGHLMMYAELEGVICSGPRRGKQFTYALLEERVPPAPALDRDQALATLARRYFSSHGPATVQDLAWWSGLTVADARLGASAAAPPLARETNTLDGKEYWYAPEQAAAGTKARSKTPIMHLLPNYDEYLIAYASYAPVTDPAVVSKTTVGDRATMLANHIIVRDGKVVGGWRRVATKDAVTIETRLLTPLTREETRALTDAARRFGRFLNCPVNISAQKRRRPAAGAAKGR